MSLSPVTAVYETLKGVVRAAWGLHLLQLRAAGGLLEMEMEGRAVPLCAVLCCLLMEGRGAMRCAWLSADQHVGVVWGF